MRKLTETVVKSAFLAAASFVVLLAGVAAAQQRPDNGEWQLGHVHLPVTDIAGALKWFGKVLGWKPVYQDARLAVLRAAPIGLVLDKSEANGVATLSFQSNDVDEDYRRMVARGAESVEPPNDKPFGVRAAYLRGPGALKIELEGPLKGKQD